MPDALLRTLGDYAAAPNTTPLKTDYLRRLHDQHVRAMNLGDATAAMIGLAGLLDAIDWAAGAGFADDAGKLDMLRQAVTSSLKEARFKVGI